MAILTDGPMLAPLDKPVSIYIAANDAAWWWQLELGAAIVAGVVVLMLAAWLAPRLWRRARGHLRGAVRMAEPH